MANEPHHPARSQNRVAIDNGVLSVSYNIEEGTFSAWRGETLFIKSGRFPEVTGSDVGARWSGILSGATMGTRLYFMHNRLWHKDPDCLMLRDPLTLERAAKWASHNRIILWQILQSGLGAAIGSKYICID